MKGTIPKPSNFEYPLIFKILALVCILTSALSPGCKKSHEEKPSPTVPGTTNGADTLAIYIPKDFRSMDFKNAASTWSYSRSKQSEHFILFWDQQYGSKLPNASDVPAAYRVNIDDLLQKAEIFYKKNVETLKFAEVEKGKSNLTKYKMLIFLYYEDTWRATGSGYDDVIGALWISPQPAQPAGGVLAHEIGHCFQYQVYCDKAGLSGFRHGFGGLTKNVFWEQTAQWQSFQNYPSEAFTTYHFDEYLENCHRHFHHEAQRYGSYFLHYYWTSKHGIDIISKIWRQSVTPDDAIQTYMRLTGINTAQLNEEIYDAATKFVTWDLPELKTIGADYIGKTPYGFDKLSDGSFQVKTTRCPGTTGYNIVPLKLPGSGTVISTQFTGIANASGYNRVDSFVAGWRYGYVALLKNGSRVYSAMFQGTTNNVSFTVPENCSKLWLVVTGAPSLYSQHGWDDNNTNDDQWPYQVKFTNTSLLNDL